MRRAILEAYRDYRGALKQSEVLALQVLKSAEAKLDAAKAGLKTASDAVANFAGTEPAERANLELTRDEHLRRVQDEEKRYQIAKDLADNLTISYNTSEVIMARLMQTTNAKERVYAQSVSFFSTNDSVLTALKASFTGLFGLHESTASLDAMKEGVSKSIEVLADIGGKVQEAAIRSGYGPTIRADAGEEAGRQRHQLPGAFARHRRRNARYGDQEFDRNPRRGRSRQPAHRAADHGRQGARNRWLTPWLRRWRGPKARPLQPVKLDDLMLAMDVVDTLRHQDSSSRANSTRTRASRS